MIPLLLLLGCAPRPTHDTLPLAEEVAARGVERWQTDDVAFDWIPTVWTYGLSRLHAATGETVWQDYYRDWLVENLPPFEADPPLPFVSSDSMSPALLAATLLVEDPDSGVEPIVTAADTYLAGAARTDEGAIEHWGPGAAFGTPGQVWVDSQFMFGLFLLRQHARTGHAAYLDTWVEQYGLFSDLCRDPETDLYHHAYDDESDANIPADPVFWARGNAWVLVSAAEALAQEGADAPALAAVLPAFQAHAAAVMAHQDPEDGLWHTVLNEPYGDDPDNYTETSGSALIAYALVVGARAGALDEDEVVPVVQAAIDGIEARIERDDDGLPVVEGTSYGTNPGDYDYYVGVGQRDDLMLGVGAVAMLLAEAQGFPAEAE